jgi:RimJ/RimL family protein N-acetyltransferase
MPEEPVLNLIGELVAIGPMRRDLLPLYSRWANDFDVMATVTPTLRPLTLESEQAWYDRAVADDHLTRFTLYVRNGFRPIGTTQLAAIDHMNRTAMYGIMIGERECWGHGYGTEATRLTLEYAFTGLGLHNVMLSVRSWNTRGIRAYTRAGFREIGRRRESVRVAGEAFDEVLMDCLASEFKGFALASLLPSELSNE